MPNPNSNFKTSDGADLGNKLITKEYLMSVYPQIANQLITPELWVWGRNAYGQLGVNVAGTTTNRTTPVTTFAGGANWKQVACGQLHMAAIKTDGTLWTWGANSYGQLGTGDTIQRNTPVQTSLGGTNWKQVACGYHTVAIKTDGTLWTWGRNDVGQLGINDTTQRLTPVQEFNNATNWKQVSTGKINTAAIKTDGTLWTWGQNAYGQLGVNDTSQRNTPVQTFAASTNWKQVACGYNMAAVKTDGTLWTWGANFLGALGINNLDQRNTPVQTFIGGTNWKQVATGIYQTMAVKTDGTLWNWGSNANGQLGTNDKIDRYTPVQTFAGGTNWRQVASFWNNVSAVKTNGTLWTWGSNDFGQLGINDTTDRCTPVQTSAGGTNWKQVACGFRFVAAIRTSDDLQGI